MPFNPDIFLNPTVYNVSTAP